MQQTTAQIHELQRRPAPAGRCQPLALYEGLLWTGSWETKHIYGIDPKSWNVVEDVPAPGTPYGIAPLAGTLHIVVSDDGEEDDRYIYRFVPRQGFVEASKTPCPQMTGSHLTSDGKRLYLMQAHERRIAALDDAYGIAQTYALTTRSGGFGFGPDGKLYFIAADAEFDNLTFGTLALNSPETAFTAIAPIDAEFRSLVHDGSAWLTSNREAGEIVSFTVR
jgi:DNA-binding beta-propeller fold protein YncE